MVPALSCPVKMRAWRAGVLLPDTDLTAVKQHLREPGVLFWMDLVDPSPTDLQTVAEHLALPGDAIEDVLAPHERAKVIRHDGRLFFMIYGASLEDRARDSDSDHERLEFAKISGFVLPTGLLTVRAGQAFDMTQVERRWNDSPDLMRAGAGALVYGLMDTVVDQHFEIIQGFDDEIESLEDELFETHPEREFLRRVYGVRKDLVRLRRIVLPMREVVNGLLRHRPDDATELARWYDDLYDHVLRAAEWTESLRDMVTTVFETHLSLQDTRLNTVMRQLAAWAAIIAVPTAITGWFGQNVPYWGFDNARGLWLSAALIVFGSTGLYFGFRRQGWL